MEQSSSTSKVTVEYFDPHDVYKLLAPGLVPRLPLRNLHWQSHSGPLRSIDTLFIDLREAGVPQPPPTAGSLEPPRVNADDGFQTQSLSARPETGEGGAADSASTKSGTSAAGGSGRRHQIPGLRQTPYLKVLLLRCDDNDVYKSQTRSEVKDWLKKNTPSSSSSRKSRDTAENHDAFEWLILHVVIPNTVASTQPRITGKAADGTTPDTTSKTASRWRGSSSTILEKLRSDFGSTSKNGTDRIAQIRIGINDVPYDLLPRVVPAVPSGYSENEVDAEKAWADLISRFKDFILTSFDVRVFQYEEDIKEKDAQRNLPGWNFCTFFILKEGLAKGFESVGLVEDALVGYDELGVGLDTILQEQATGGSAEAHGGALLTHTDDLFRLVDAAIATSESGEMEFEQEEAVDLQTKEVVSQEKFKDIPISAMRKPYRELILANNVSVFDFRCYIFARQVALLLRLGNASSTRAELLAKLKEQQASVLLGVAPSTPAPKPTDESENLSMLAEICRRTLAFVPSVSHVMRQDIFTALRERRKQSGSEPAEGGATDPLLNATVSAVAENAVVSFAFSVAQQILAQTSTKALPIPPSTLSSPGSQEQRLSVPEPRALAHPTRSSSLSIRPSPQQPSSPTIFSHQNRRASVPEADAANTQFVKAGLEDLAARRAELYMLSRDILNGNGKKRGWSDGWSAVPLVGGIDDSEMVEISLDTDNDGVDPAADSSKEPSPQPHITLAGIDSELLRTALASQEDFYRLYETMTDKALRHFTVAGYTHSVQTNVAALAVLRYHLEDYEAAAHYFYQATPFFGESAWTLLELSLLILYSTCLEKLDRKDEYVRVVVKLLSKAAMARRDRLHKKGMYGISSTARSSTPETTALLGFVPTLLETVKDLPKETRVPAASLLCDANILGVPAYHQGRDSFSLRLRLRSLLVEDLPINKMRARIVGFVGGNPSEIWLETQDSCILTPGGNEIELSSNVMAPGKYRMDQIRIFGDNICLHHDSQVSQAAPFESTLLQASDVTLYHRAGGIDVRVSAAKHLQLDKNHSLDLQWSSGWNDITHCELRVRAATGGLRLLTADATIVDSSSTQFSQRPEGNLFSFGRVAPNTDVKIRLPFTIEQEVLEVNVKIEITYTTEHGTFTFAKTPSINVALALGVNVQDVFKHKGLFSRFAVSTASISPLRLYDSRLIDSEVFASEFSIPPAMGTVIHPKQPASLIFKITRKPGVKLTAKSQKTMYLRLEYSVLQDEIEALVERSIHAALKEASLQTYSHLVVDDVIAHLSSALSFYGLEHAALLGEVPTEFLSDIDWEGSFGWLGKLPDSDEFIASHLADFVRSWSKQNPTLSIDSPGPVGSEIRSISIPVDVPSVPVVHTADIQLQTPAPDFLAQAGIADSDGVPIACINQALQANLHLKWSRIWDTGNVEPGGKFTPPAAGGDLEFSYEVTAPSDTWLLGGRRKGHFVIPSQLASAAGQGFSSDAEGVISTADSEADVPLVMIPLREGWLPYPSVEIREIRQGAVDSQLEGGGAGMPCEVDWRNLGESVRVVSNRAKVTVSLDASGPGGGPLVLEAEGYESKVAA